MKKGHRHGLDHSLARRNSQQHDRDPRRATRPPNKLAWWVGIDRVTFQHELRARFSDPLPMPTEGIAVHRITAADVAAHATTPMNRYHRTHKKAVAA